MGSALGIGLDLGDIFNPGGEEAGKAAARLTDEQVQLLRQLAQQSGTVFGYGKNEYEANQPLIADMRDRAKYLGSEAGQRSEAGRATSDVTRAYTRAKEAEQRDMMRMGLNPSDPAARSMRGAGLVRLASARSGAGDVARRAARTEGYGLTKFLSGRESGLLNSGMQGLSQAASGFGQATQNTQNDPRQGLLGIPGLSLRRGGRIYAPMGGRVPGEEAGEPRGYNDEAGEVHGPGAGIVRDPNPSRTMPMMRGADGVYRSPDETGEGGNISGPGTETSDSIPARLSHGEYVLPAFVGEAMGTPATDALVEVARGAQEGDPMATDDLMRLLKTISAFKFTQAGGAPKRVAGQEPKAPQQAMERGVGLGHITARGGGRMVRRMKPHTTYAPSGGLVDSGARIFRLLDRDASAPSTEGSASPVPPGAGPTQPLPWWGQFETRTEPTRPGQTSLRNAAATAAKLIALAGAHGGHVGAGLYARS